MKKTQDFIANHKEESLSQLFDLLRIPSISANLEMKPEMIKTAESVKQSLLDAGVDMAELCETPGNPIVYAEKIIDPSLPTVVVYGHYDVQPADP
jgi:acetylornithine deacetylase/succinyl-diaminopimelate desuccinylase-like protein